MSAVVARNTPRDTGRPQSLALPTNHEFWLLLERYNKAALARRFPDWSGAPGGVSPR